MPRGRVFEPRGSRPALEASMSFLVLFSLLPDAAVAAPPPADKVKLVKLFEVPNYCEGVVFDHEGFGYISHGKVITRFTSDGKHEVWAETGAPNGHKVLADGTHLVCDASHRAVLRLDKNGKIIGKASSECDGKPLRGPNDLTLDFKGAFYFTDPGGSDDKKPIGTVHYVDAEGKTHLVAEGLAFPNGILLTPDRRRLYVAESKKNRILEYSLRSPGVLGKMRVLAELPEAMGEQIDNQPDGMCLDVEGNLYIAHYGMRQVQVYSPKGELVRRYPAGNLTTSNVGFSGAKMNQLYVTGGLGKESGRGGLFRMELEGVKGLVILPARKVKDDVDPVMFNDQMVRINNDFTKLGVNFGTALAAKNIRDIKDAFKKAVAGAARLQAEADKLKPPSGDEGAEFYAAYQEFFKTQEKIIKEYFKDMMDLAAAGKADEKQIVKIIRRIQDDEDRAMRRVRAAQRVYAEAHGITLFK
jgi:gluconolactonase